MVSVLDVYTHFIPFFPKETIALQERFVVMYLNRNNRILGIYPMSVGGITSALVDIRLILSVALKVVATSIAIAHNHPSGELNPSEADREITDKIKEACKLMDIRLIDHLILSPTGEYLSFENEGFI
ncbi:MAG: JAB domain-containing protein [Chitinophagaceae bacterium]|nr:JAB domain-containing protein [Chitinophagaceae bacterium]